MRVLDVVEVLGVLDFPALLALKGRQNTDGGKQRAAPGHGGNKQIPSPREGARGWGALPLSIFSCLSGAKPFVYLFPTYP